ncbi:uncharacterized protein LOC126375512 [Pectinophora gossypiella]|uniref:uncharacterized protein LOC126375512 n=1 Tax=Pectinophora gossypiella TaxID=13191 RepID=UPI00214F10AB|nr:uncharacterized protein LOC126375512 [Pectinophora gossypiella]
MSVSDAGLADRKSRMQQIYGSMGQLEKLLKIFSLDSKERKITTGEKRWYIFKCILSVSLFTVLVIVTTSYKIRNVYPSLNVSIALTDFVQNIFDNIQYIIDLFFVYKYGKEISIEYYRQYECFDEIMNVNYYSEIKKRVAVLIGVFFFFWLISSAFDIVAWYLGYDLLVPLVFAPAYVFLFIKILTNLDISAHVMNIECRLRIIGDIVQETCIKTEDLPMNTSVKSGFIDAVSNKHWFYSEGNNRCSGMRLRLQPLKSVTSSQDMKLLSRCYLLLSEQCMYINSVFGVRILLNSLSLLIDMVRFLNVVVRIAVGSQQTVYNAGYFPAASTLCRFLVCVCVLASLVRHCELAYRQQERLLSVADHILVNKKPDDSLRSGIQELRALVVSRPVRFNMAYFFTLNYSFLVSIASVVVTYTIILLQSL